MLTARRTEGDARLDVIQAVPGSVEKQKGRLDLENSLRNGRARLFIDLEAVRSCDEIREWRFRRRQLSDFASRVSLVHLPTERNDDPPHPAIPFSM